MLTAAAQITAENWPGYAGCCVLVYLIGAGFWALLKKPWS